MSPVITLTEIEAQIVFDHDPEPLRRGFVEAVHGLKLFNEFRIEALRTAVFAQITVCIAISPPPPPMLDVAPDPCPCNCAIICSTGPPGTRLDNGERLISRSAEDGGHHQGKAAEDVEQT